MKIQWTVSTLSVSVVIALGGCSSVGMGMKWNSPWGDMSLDVKKVGWQVESVKPEATWTPQHDGLLFVGATDKVKVRAYSVVQGTERQQGAFRTDWLEHQESGMIPVKSGQTIRVEWETTGESTAAKPNVRFVHF